MKLVTSTELMQIKFKIRPHILILCLGAERVYYIQEQPCAFLGVIDAVSLGRDCSFTFISMVTQIPTNFGWYSGWVTASEQLASAGAETTGPIWRVDSVALCLTKTDMASPIRP